MNISTLLSGFLAESRRTIGRYPLPLGAGLAATCLATLLMLLTFPAGEPEDNPPLLTLALSAYMSVPWLLGMQLLAQRQGWNRKQQQTAMAAALLPPIGWGLGYYSCLPNIDEYLPQLLVPWGLSYLWVLTAPFLGERSDIPLLKENLRLHVSMLAGGLFSWLALAALTLALLIAFETPPERPMPKSLLPILGCWSALLALLLGLSFAHRYSPSSRMRALALSKLLIALLLPVSVTLLAGLYLYMAKILLLWSWPSGVVAPLVLGTSAVTMALLLCSFHLRQHPDHPWVRAAHRYGYQALLPLAAMLALSVGMRIQEYGITPERYLLIQASILLTFISLYMVVSKGRGLKAIPLAIAVLACISAYGPTNLHAVSGRSQLARGRQIAHQYQALDAQGQLDLKRVDRIPTEERLQLQEAASFLTSRKEYHPYLRKLLPAQQAQQLIDNPGALGKVFGIEP